MAKILIVEDDKQLADMVRTSLLFDHHLVELVGDGEAASTHLRTCDYDLIVLDWGLPGKSGIEICKEFRSQGGRTPILMLTGKAEIADTATGLDSGADDYLAKPFNVRELTARVRALLRRPVGYTETTLTAGNLSLDPIKHRVHRDGQPVPLLPKEFALLEFMMRHPNQVFSPEALLNHVWPSDSEATAAALRTTMKRLRAKIDPDNKLIRTEHGVGYILEAS